MARSVAPVLMIATTTVEESAVIAAIIIARLFVPLLIPRFPLVIIAALILDAVDGSLLDAFTSVDVGPDGPYQSFDKALDIYYLAIAYLTTLRNWTSHAARSASASSSSTTGWSACCVRTLGARAMLLIFPNTFEFFFIAYEAIRRASTRRGGSAQFWLYGRGAVDLRQAAAGVLDPHRATRLHRSRRRPSVVRRAVRCSGSRAGGVLWFVVRPRLPAPDWSWRFAAEPLPAPAARGARGAGANWPRRRRCWR